MLLLFISSLKKYMLRWLVKASSCDTQTCVATESMLVPARGIPNYPIVHQHHYWAVLHVNYPFLPVMYQALHFRSIIFILNTYTIFGVHWLHLYRRCLELIFVYIVYWNRSYVCRGAFAKNDDYLLISIMLVCEWVKNMRLRVNRISKFECLDGVSLDLFTYFI